MDQLRYSFLGKAGCLHTHYHGPGEGAKKTMTPPSQNCPECNHKFKKQPLTMVLCGRLQECGWASQHSHQGMALGRVPKVRKPLRHQLDDVLRCLGVDTGSQALRGHRQGFLEDDIHG